MPALNKDENSNDQSCYLSLVTVLLRKLGFLFSHSNSLYWYSISEFSHCNIILSKNMLLQHMLHYPCLPKDLFLKSEHAKT